MTKKTATLFLVKNKKVPPNVVVYIKWVITKKVEVKVNFNQIVILP